jgi:DNA primase
MRSVRDNTGSDSNSEQQNKGWDVNTADRDVVKLLVQQANTADLLTIFKAYGIDINDGYGTTKKCNCPLPKHDDKTPSFYYYTDTNSFYCFGCKAAGKAVRLVSLMEGLNYEDAARKIVSNFYTNNDVEIENNTNSLERQEIILGFSKTVREFIQSNKEDEIAIEYVEKLTLAFDTLTQKHKLEKDGLKKMIMKLKVKLNEYK